MSASPPTRFLGAALLAIVLTPVVAEVVTTDLFIVGTGDVLTEDVYVAAQSGTVEGTIDGDLTYVGGDLTISGTVTGSVNALSGASVSVTETGRIDGSLRTVARQVTVAGSVAEDVAATAVTVRIDAAGAVARDLVAFGGTLDIAGSAGRDVRGRIFDVGVSGSVGNDLDVTVSRLTVGRDAVIGGDVLYRSAGEASIADGATIRGQVVALPSSPNFLYGIILTLANIVSLLGFLVIGLVILWLFRGTARRAAMVAIRRPLRSLLVGLAATVVAPVLVVLFAVTLVGLPLALALVVLILLGLVVGPIPIVTAVGDRLLRRRGGLFGGFVVGALLWRLGIWFLPWIGGFVFLAGLIWGVGAWLVAAWEQRAATGDVDLLPAAMRLDDDTPRFDFPLPPPKPSATAATPERAPVDVGAETADGPPPDLSQRIAAITGDEVVPGVDRPPIVEPDADHDDDGDGVAGGEDDWGLPG